MIKKIAKLIIPNKFIYLIKTSIVYWPDIKRYTKHSNTFYRADNPNKIKGHMTILYHIIEKGLTMPETRLGFGIGILQELIAFCKDYIKKGYDTTDPIFIHSVEVLNEYLKFHDMNHFSVDKEVIRGIKDVSSLVGIETCSCQYHFSDREFFKYNQSSFFEFCKSRHSSRNFSDKEIPLDTIYQCIELANNSPSDCNRQPTRVYIVRNRKMINEVLELQNGNRGFGHLAKVILVITSDISLFQGNERNEPLLNAGLFSMTLLYALHFHKIGACLLNWAASALNDSKLRNVIQIPENEQIAVLVACGYLPSELKIATSPRVDVSEITHEMN